VEPHRQAVNQLLLQISELVRTAARPERRPKDRRGADLIGAKLKGADLRAVSLRGAYLIGADLRGADLTSADLIGADFRGCRPARRRSDRHHLPDPEPARRGQGNRRTRLPAALRYPSHWPADA
jgi:uncharacterized protein YjbI with pentapeptide repeats